MGTRFIGCGESLASAGYKRMLIESGMDDIVTTRAFTGIASNMLRPSIIAAGLDPLRLDETVTPVGARETFGGATAGLRRWRDLWSAGHGVAGITDVPPLATVVARLADEYRANACG